MRNVLSLSFLLCTSTVLSAVDQYQKSHRDPSGLLPPYIVTHVPANYGMIELRERLTTALLRPVSLLHSFPLAAVTLFPPESAPPLSHSSLISQFRNLDPLQRTLFNLDPLQRTLFNLDPLQRTLFNLDPLQRTLFNLDPLQRTLFNLDPIHSGIVNYAFALPISSSHPELKRNNIAQGKGEKIFGIMSVKGPPLGSGEKGGIKELSVLGFAKAHHVQGFDEMLEKAWADPYAIELGSVVNAHELFSHVHTG